MKECSFVGSKGMRKDIAVNRERQLDIYIRYLIEKIMRALAGHASKRTRSF